jgi:hypothetical protein
MGEREGAVVGPLARAMAAARGRSVTDVGRDPSDHVYSFRPAGFREIGLWGTCKISRILGVDGSRGRALNAKAGDLRDHRLQHWFASRWSPGLEEGLAMTEYMIQVI